MTYVWVDSVGTKDRDGQPLIFLFGRDTENPGRVKKFTVRDFYPYFYVPEMEARSADVRCTEREVILDALGRKIRKVYVNNSSEVRNSRQQFSWTDEADILFDMRYVIDNNITYGFNEDLQPEETAAILPRICYFDIEVRNPPNIFPAPEKSEWPIVSIQVGDSYSDNDIIFTYGVPQTSFPGHVALDTERELILSFVDYIENTDFDVLTGWYSNGFDIPYIVTRADILGIDIRGLSRVRWPPKADKRGEEFFVRIPGRQCVDMKQAFQKWYKAEGELEKFDLKSVVANPHVMGDNAFAYTDYGGSIEKLFTEKDWETFLQYCQNDVIALRRIDETIKLFDFYENLRHMVGIKIEDTMNNSRIIDTILLRWPAMRPMPTKQYGVKAEDYEGALVILPPIGIFSSVGVFDLAALYPTIIIALNISPDIDGIIPLAIKTMMDERERLRALKKAGLADDATKKKEIVVKFIVNSFYGVLGWPGFRLYRPEQAAKITRTGREINMRLQAKAREEGHIVLYGDTDSVFIDDIPDIKSGLEMERIFNEDLILWQQENNAVIAPTLKFEKLYRRILFKKSSSSDKAAKKRYAGHLIATDDGPCDKLSMTGMEVKRSDQAQITKDVMTEFLDKVLLHDDIDSALIIVKNAMKSFDDEKADIYDISIPRGIRTRIGNNPHVRGIHVYEELTDDVFPHEVKPRLIYCKGLRREICIFEDAKIDKVRQLIRIDWKKQQETTIGKKMRPLVESIGYNWREVVKGQIAVDTFGESEGSLFDW